MAVLCLERLMTLATEDEKNWIRRFKEKYSKQDGRYPRMNALRQRRFDRIANDYISNNPSCTVVDLASGFDTRFWRIANENCTYIELDLPELIDVKREVLKDHLKYELIGCSVLDTSWIDQVTANGSSNFQLIAEGLFMYLPKQEATELLQYISQHFGRSQLVLDMIPEWLTKGFWKWVSDRIFKRIIGLDVSMVFGIKNPKDFEDFGEGFEVMDHMKGSVGPIITVSINGA